MVESKLVELVVAGSNPVGHPRFVLFNKINVFAINQTTPKQKS